MSYRRASLAVAGFLAVAVLVDSGAAAPLDRFGLRHLPTWYDGLDSSVTGPLHEVAAAADPLPAILVTAIACAGLLVRGRRRAAAAWLVSIGLAFAVELVGKLTVDQIRVVGATTTIAGIRVADSFPSGHAIRSVLMAGAVSEALPMARRPALAWAIVTVVVVSLSRGHVLTDVIGGVLAGAALVGWARRPGRPRAG